MERRRDWTAGGNHVESALEKMDARQAGSLVTGCGMSAVQLAALLDRLTLRRIIAFIPVVILVLAYITASRCRRN